MTRTQCCVEKPENYCLSQLSMIYLKNRFHEIFAKNDSESKHYSVSTLVMNANFLKFSLVRLLGFNLVLSLNSTAEFGTLI